MTEVGFGKASTTGNNRRLVNKDGTFNLTKVGVGIVTSLTAYDKLIKASWRKFFFSLAVIYTCSNLIFAAVYSMLGSNALAGAEYHNQFSYFVTCFFFSIQTFATIGYGVIHPIGTVTNSIVAVESLVGILEVSIFTGLMFARFSRPQVNVMFSHVALIAPFKESTSLQFRLMNIRASQLLEPRVRVVFSKIKTVNGIAAREYYPLKLLIDQVIFLPLYWTITHVIDENSPLYGMSEQEFIGSKPEYLVLFSAIDEVTGENIYVRTSYYTEEFVYDAQFVSMYVEGDNSLTKIEVDKLHQFRKLPTAQALLS